MELAPSDVQARVIAISMTVLTIVLLAAPALRLIDARSGVYRDAYTAFVAAVAVFAGFSWQQLLRERAAHKVAQRELARQVLIALDDLLAAFGSDPRAVVRPKVELVRALARVVRREAGALTDVGLRDTVDHACACMEWWFHLDRAGLGSPRDVAYLAHNAARTALAGAMRNEVIPEDPELANLFVELDRLIRSVKRQRARRPLWRRRIVKRLDEARGHARYESEFRERPADQAQAGDGDDR